MRDVREQMKNVWRMANRLRTDSSGGRTLMFVAVHQGEGVTSVAASVAVLASRRADKPIWLVDLDLRRNGLYKGFRKRVFSDLGEPGRAYDAGLRQTPIYSITPNLVTGEDQKLLSGHEMSGSRLFVTRFRNEYLRDGQRVKVRTSPGWWHALRKIADWIIVDAPALERSPAALVMASQMDGVIIVVEADKTTAQEVSETRQEIEAHGGNVIGLVMNRVGADARLAHRLVN